MKKIKKIYIAFVLFLIGIIAIPNTFAADNIIKVSGTKTRDQFQKILDDAPSGSIIELDAVSYGKLPANQVERLSNQIIIDKNITIRGQGIDKTTFSFELIIKSRDGKVPTNVSLSNYKTIAANKKTDEYVVDVQTPITLNVDKIKIWEIYRATSEPIDVAAFNISEGASGSTININNSLIESSYDGILFNDASNVTLNVKNSTFGGWRLAMDLKNGSNNKIYFSDNCKIVARYSYYRNDEAINISNQKKLIIDIKDSTITAADSGENNPATPDYVFSFSGENKSTDTIVYLHGNTKIIDGALNAGSAVFNFGNSNEPDDNNRFIFMDTVEFINYKDVPVYFLFKYNLDEKYAAVGIKDTAGVTTVQTYLKGSTISKKELNYPDTLNKDNRIYKLKDIHYLKANGITDITGILEDENITVSDNMEIYPNYLKQLNIKIFSSPKTFNALEGDSYSEFKTNLEVKTLLDTLSDSKTLNKEFVKFVEEDDETIEINDDYNFTKDITIIPKYDVIVTIEGIEFRISEGKTVKDIIDPRLEALKTRNDRTFSRYIKDGEIFDETTEIHENITLSIKQNVKVTIDQDVYELGEDLTLADLKNEEAKAKLTEMQNTNNKKFLHFVDDDGEEIDENYKFTKDTKITPVYSITVTIKYDGKDETCTLNEGETLNDLTGTAKEKLQELQNIKTKEFTKFVNQKGETVELTTALHENTEITPKYNVKVTIDDVVFTLEEGKTLKDITDSQLETLKNKNGRKFSRFIKDGETFKDTTEIHENITLTIKQFVKVTIKDTDYELEEGKKLNMASDIVKALESLKQVQNKTFKEYYNLDNDVEVIDGETVVNDDLKIGARYTIEVKINGQSYLLDEGKTLNDLAKEAKDELQHLQNITTKEFTKFVNQKGETVELTTALHENTEITPKYNVKVTIDDVVFTLEEGKTLKDITDSQLETLKNKNGRKFSRFIKDGETFKDTTEIHENITLSIKQFVKVTIKDTDYELEEGKKLSSSPEILIALNELVKVDNKIFEYYYNLDNSDEIITAETVVNDDLKIGAKYEIIITINNQTYSLDEGKTLNDLPKEAKDELQRLQTVTSKVFTKFVNQKGETVELTTALHENTEITPKYNIKVTIDDVIFTLEEGKTLKDITDSQLETLKNKNGRKFSRYIKDGETFEDTTEIHENITLTIKQFVKVTIKDTDYELEEGKKLNMSSDIVKAMEELKKVQDKTFKEYYNLDNVAEIIDGETVANADLKIGAHYTIEVKINGQSYSLDEGKTLNDLPKEAKDELQHLQNITTKEFTKFVNQKGETVELTTPLYENTEVKAQYNVRITIDEEEFIISEGKTLKDITDSRLETLKNKNGRKFSRFIKDGETFKDTTEIHENITLAIKQFVKVTIKDTDYELEEGLKLNDSSEIIKALDNLKNIKTKNFQEYYNVDTNQVLTKELVVNSNLKINARYTITITINDKDYELNENQTLNDLPEEVVADLKNEMAKEHFDRFADHNDKTVDLDTKLVENTKIIAKYDILVTIDDETFVLEEGKTLNDLKEADQARLEKLIEPLEGQTFVGYKDKETGEMITAETPITKDIELELIFEKLPNEVPKTLDNIINYIIAGIVSLTTAIGGVIFLKRKHNA